MQLTVEIKNESLIDKIVELLNVFKDDGIRILNYEAKEKDEKKQDLMNSKWDKEFAAKHWKEIIMNTHSADMDDDKRLYEAAARFYHEKYSD